MKYIEKLQYITHDLPNLTHIEQVQLACEAGAKWIQYRCLTKGDDGLLADINAIAEICDDWGTTLIVTNHSHLHGKADIQGFHMEESKTDFIALRSKLGNDVTIGSSASTIEHLMQLQKEGADYAFFGPFAADDTRIRMEDYVEAANKFKELEFPILANGGIKIYDVEAVMQAGVYGVAVSAAIYDADDFIEAYQDFYEAVKL